jgi:hypothetical protein
VSAAAAINSAPPTRLIAEATIACEPNIAHLGAADARSRRSTPSSRYRTRCTGSEQADRRPDEAQVGGDVEVERPVALVGRVGFVPEDPAEHQKEQQRKNEGEITVIGSRRKSLASVQVDVHRTRTFIRRSFGR